MQEQIIKNCLQKFQRNAAQSKFPKKTARTTARLKSLPDGLLAQTSTSMTSHTNRANIHVYIGEIDMSKVQNKTKQRDCVHRNQTAAILMQYINHPSTQSKNHQLK
jgi:hypothetical protein